MGIEMGKESETVKTFIVILLCAIAGHAQTAKVVALSREDSDKAIHLRAELDRAQKALDDFNQEVKDKYTSDLVEEKKDTCTSDTWTGFLTSATTICLVGPGCPEPTPEEKRKAKEAQDTYDARCIRPSRSSRAIRLAERLHVTATTSSTSSRRNHLSNLCRQGESLTAEFTWWRIELHTWNVVARGLVVRMRMDRRRLVPLHQMRKHPRAARLGARARP